MVNDVRCQTTASEDGGDLQVDQALDPVMTCGDIPTPDRSGDGLGETANLDDPGQTIEGCEPGRWRMLEIGENVVLDDQQARGLSELEQPVRSAR